MRPEAEKAAVIKNGIDLAIRQTDNSRHSTEHAVSLKRQHHLSIPQVTDTDGLRKTTRHKRRKLLGRGQRRLGRCNAAQ